MSLSVYATVLKFWELCIAVRQPFLLGLHSFNCITSIVSPRSSSFNNSPKKPNYLCKYIVSVFLSTENMSKRNIKNSHSVPFRFCTTSKLFWYQGCIYKWMFLEPQPLNELKSLYLCPD